LGLGDSDQSASQPEAGLISPISSAQFVGAAIQLPSDATALGIGDDVASFGLQ
jgi:hypothetical protein